jgi:hypothetical protein
MINVLSGMFQKRNNIDRLRVASPCPMNWAAMTGDERARYCDLCKLHVYNISEMTRSEVKKLITGTEGRICVRLYKRADGTVLTKDCPVGLRAMRRKVGRIAGASISAIFSFCMSVFGQSSVQIDKSCPSNAKVTIERSQVDRSQLRGVISDVNGAVIPNVNLTFTNLTTQKKTETVSNEVGLFKFAELEIGSYDLNVQAAGFKPVVIRHIDVEPSQSVIIELLMFYEGDSVNVGFIISESVLDNDSPGLKKTFGTGQINNLPF